MDSSIEVEVERRILLYKEVYMLNRDFNASFGKFLVPFLKLAFVLVFVMSFYASVRLYTAMNGFSYSFAVLLECESFLLVGPMAMLMSSMFDISTQFFRHLPPRIQKIPGKVTRKICTANLKSCAVIRFQVGSFYYMEAQAKLTSMGYLVHGIVFLMVNLN